MDINKIKEIVNSNESDSIKKIRIITTISKDETAIPMILQILTSERQFNNELISDMNLELSRAEVEISTPGLAGNNKNQAVAKEESKNFVLNKIAEFYRKYKGSIRHSFNKEFN